MPGKKIVALSRKNVDAALEWALANEETTLGRTYVDISCSIGGFDIQASEKQLEAIHPKKNWGYLSTLFATKDLLFQARDTLGREILTAIKNAKKS